MSESHPESPEARTTFDLEERLRLLVTSSAQLEIASKEKDKIIRRSRRLADVGMLAAFVAHRFGNILHVVRGRAALLRNQLPDSSGVPNEHFEEISKECRRGERVVDTLKNYATPREPQSTPVQLNDIIKEVISNLGILFPKTEIRFEFSDLPLVIADYFMLQEVLVNLFLNAVDAMGSKGILTLVTRPVVLDEQFCWQHPPLRPGPAVKITVQDSGPGIAPQILPYLFKPFMTTKPGTGTGLGLLIAKQHVEKHRGWIGGINLPEPERGACFTIFLPLNTID